MRPSSAACAPRRASTSAPLAPPASTIRANAPNAPRRAVPMLLKRLLRLAATRQSASRGAMHISHFRNGSLICRGGRMCVTGRPLTRALLLRPGLAAGCAPPAAGRAAPAKHPPCCADLPACAARLPLAGLSLEAAYSVRRPVPAASAFARVTRPPPPIPGCFSDCGVCACQRHAPPPRGA